MAEDVRCSGCMHFDGLHCAAGVCAAVRSQMRGKGWPVPAEEPSEAGPVRKDRAARVGGKRGR